MVITLSEEEVKEAILEYLENHQDELLGVNKNPGPPEMKFLCNPNNPPGKQLTAEVEVEGEVHPSRHPYR